jgi:acyl carrier protein
MDKNKEKALLDKIKSILSEILGIDKGDIQNEDSFTDDLRMGPTELSDFTAKLAEEGYDTVDLSFEEVDTVEDLYESISSQEDI